MEQLSAGDAIASTARLAPTLARHGPPLVTCTVPNVPGHRETLYFAGARLAGMLAVGPISDGMGLIHAVTSYLDELAITLTAGAAMLPDGDFYADLLRQSVEDLAAATGT